MSDVLHAAARAARTGNDEFLLTPGPLTTSLAVKQAMLRDWGSRDTQFIALNARIREKLVAIASGERTHVCVPVQRPDLDGQGRLGQAERSGRGGKPAVPGDRMERLELRVIHDPSI